ncbi:MAG TPA: aminopeptidase, partial [Bacteroidaceae bacterium]|nr:aminopeptidase [Bacteroidaceae bacterium]
MKKIFVLALVALCTLNVSAKSPKKDKEKEGYKFTTVKANPITSIKNQNRSSTCW